MKNKKGDEKYYIIISLILGLIILTLAMYFLFQEYFTQDDINWEICRESVILRSGNMGGGTKEKIAKSLQEQFPFKCKTQVIEITPKYDHEEALEEIADTLAQCYYTYGEGNKKLYADDWGFKTTHCFVCARIDFDEEFIKENTQLEVGKYLVENKISKQETYFEYLYEHNKQLDIETENKIKESLIKNKTFNTKDGDIFVVYTYYPGGKTPWWLILIPQVGFPIYVYNYIGDSISAQIDEEPGSHKITLGYFQEKNTPNMFDDGAGLNSCNVIETIPA